MENEIEDDLIGPVADEATTTETETPAEGTTEPSAVVEPASSEGSEPKSPFEAITAAVDEANKPRSITPKAEEAALTDTRPRNADGTFKTETPEEKLARETADAAAAALKNETPEAKAAREAAEAAAKKVDHVNDEIPKDLNRRTADRMKYLIDTVKQQNVLVEQHGALFSQIQSTGASPDEFAAMVNYMRAMHSDDATQLQGAYTMLQSELRALAVRMGKPLYEVNLLRETENADLVVEIQEGKITANRAHEIALAREMQKTKTTRAAATTATTSAQQEEAQAVRDFDALDTELRKKDGDAVFQAKFDILVPMLRKLFTRVAPAERKGIFLDHYNELKVAAPAAPIRTAAASGTAAVPPVVKQQPLRTKTPAGAGSVQAGPKSALEAINMALEG